jgi:hypothetical protein
MSRDDCGDCADLGEQLDQAEADAEEFCLRIAELEAERTKLHAVIDEYVDECGADWIAESHGLKWSSTYGWHFPKGSAS